jgi:ABC-2 type transport system ATP-binding protein
MQEVLNLVGLSDTGRKITSKFSLGMKQRLSIGIALLHNPSLIILDEPTNGLDPNGIIEIRELLKKMNREHGISIVISSHLLAEIEKLVTHIGIIHHGKMMFQGTLDELKEKQQQSAYILLETNDVEGASKVIRQNNLTSSLQNGKIIIPLVPRQTVSYLNQQLVNNGIEVYEISTIKNDLETIFMDIIAK